MNIIILLVGALSLFASVFSPENLNITSTESSIPDALAAGGVTFVTLASAIIGLFVSGKIVAGGTYDRQSTQIDRLTAALEKQNELTEALLRERNQGVR